MMIACFFFILASQVGMLYTPGSVDSSIWIVNNTIFDGSQNYIYHNRPLWAADLMSLTMTDVVFQYYTYPGVSDGRIWYINCNIFLFAGQRQYIYDYCYYSKWYLHAESDNDECDYCSQLCYWILPDKYCVLLFLSFSVNGKVTLLDSTFTNVAQLRFVSNQFPNMPVVVDSVQFTTNIANIPQLLYFDTGN